MIGQLGILSVETASVTHLPGKTFIHRVIGEALIIISSAKKEHDIHDQLSIKIMDTLRQQSA